MAKRSPISVDEHIFPNKELKFAELPVDLGVLDSVVGTGAGIRSAALLGLAHALGILETTHKQR